MGTVEDTVIHGIGNGGVTDERMPGTDRYLGDQALGSSSCVSSPRAIVSPSNPNVLKGDTTVFFQELDDQDPEHDSGNHPKSGNFPPEWVATLFRNRRQLRSGICSHSGRQWPLFSEGFPEAAESMGRNRVSIDTIRSLTVP